MTTSTADTEQLNPDDNDQDDTQHALLVNGVLGALSETQDAIDAAQAASERAALLDVVLCAAFPAHDTGTYPRHELPHLDLIDLVERSAQYGGLAHFGEQLASRKRMAERIVDALTAELAPAPPADVVDVDGQQPVHTSTLRRWAVWCDQIAEHADARRRLATNGARHLADHIRIEIAHPLNRPDLDPASYRDPAIFDADRQDPATTEETP